MRLTLALAVSPRIATELELHLPAPTHTAHLSALPAAEEHARVLLSRARIWLNCVCVDRSVSTQQGKPSAIVVAAPGLLVRAVPRGLAGWWRSALNLGQDFHICAYADLLLVVSAARRAVPCLFWGGG
jgi:hypothetical protein